VSPSRAATSASFNVTTGTSSSGWTTYLQGNNRTGFATGESGFNPTSVKKLHLAWQTSDAGPDHGVFSQPVVSNGLVYWGSFDGYEHATDTSGNLVWQKNLGTTSPPACSGPSSAGIASTATVTTDVPVGTTTSILYVGGGNSKVYALGGTLYEGDMAGNLYALTTNKRRLPTAVLGQAVVSAKPLPWNLFCATVRPSASSASTASAAQSCRNGSSFRSAAEKAMAASCHNMRGRFLVPDCPGAAHRPSIWVDIVISHCRYTPAGLSAGGVAPVSAPA
jgi:hypothetical protein